MKLDRTTLPLPVAQGVRFVALALLDDTTAALERLARDDDSDALHDFRVALRRLRSWLRAFRVELGDGVKRADRHALRTMARATNRERDLEIQREWLERVSRRWTGDRRRAARKLIRRLRPKPRRARRAGYASLLRDYERIRTRLHDRLSTVTLAVREVPPVSLGDALSAQLVPHARALGRALSAVHAPTDEDQAHQARIAVKRLRYLLEPAAAALAGGRAVLRELKRMQDDLGALHDVHVVAQALRTWNEGDAEALIARAHRDAVRIHRRAAPRWFDGRFEPLEHEMERTARRMARAAAPTRRHGTIGGPQRQRTGDVS